MFKVLIACYANWDTSAEMPFLLKKSGCIVDVYCSKKSWLISNKYYNKWIESSSTDENYFRELIYLVENSNYNWIILADDILIKKANDYIKDEAIFKKIMPINNIEQRYFLSSKNGFSKFCVDNNINTPKYYTYNKKEDALEIRNKLNFPIVNKLEFSWGGTDMQVSYTFDEFYKNLNKIPEDQNILIQEFLEGEELRVDALYYDGILVTYLTSNALDYTKNRFSYNTRRRYYENKSIFPLLKDLGAKTGLNGFANITYIKDIKNEKYYLIEIDPRPNSWIANSRFIAKNNFFEGVKNIISKKYIHGFQEMGIKNSNVEIALFYKDIRRAIWKKDYTGIMKWVLNIKGYWRFLPFYDLKLTKRVMTEIWHEVFVFKWKRIIGKI